MQITIEKEAFSGDQPERGFTAKVFYLQEPNGKALIEIYRDGRPYRRFLYPTYGIWNIAPDTTWPDGLHLVLSHVVIPLPMASSIQRAAHKGGAAKSDIDASPKSQSQVEPPQRAMGDRHITLAAEVAAHVDTASRLEAAP